MEITGSSVFDRETVETTYKMALFTEDHKKGMVRVTILYAVLFTLWLALLLITRPASGFERFFLISMTALTVLLYGLMCYSYYVLPRKQYNNMGSMKDVVNDFLFTDDEIRFRSKGVKFEGESVIKYESVLKTKENDRYLLLYQTKRQFLVVDKTTLSGGTAADIVNKIRQATHA